MPADTPRVLGSPRLGDEALQALTGKCTLLHGGWGGSGAEMKKETPGRGNRLFAKEQHARQESGHAVPLAEA